MIKNIYDREELVIMVEEGVIEIEEEGFMQGYIAG